MSLGICSVFRNEAPWLREWIEFHRLVGVKLFILYNNLSTDDYQAVLQPYIEKGIVLLYDWPIQYQHSSEWDKIQCTAISEGITKARERNIRWLAIVDSDEFLYSPKIHPGQSILSVLDSYISSPAIAVNWQMYGTSGVKKVPKDQLMIESLFLKAEWDYNENRAVKCIVQPWRVLFFHNQHCGVYTSGKQVATDRTPFEGATSPRVLVDTLRINHYWSRDEEYFETRKCPRRESWGEHESGQRSRLACISAVVDQEIVRFAPLLRRALGMG